MRKTLAASVAVAVLTLAVPAQASAECVDPSRPIHYPPFCLTEAEYVALTAPQPPPVPPSGLSVSLEAQVRTIAWYFWPDWAAERMIRIAKCESNYDPTAVNSSSGAAGVWQIMPFWKRVWPGDHLDAWTNGAVAYQIWLSQGFTAWVCKGY